MQELALKKRLDFKSFEKFTQKFHYSIFANFCQWSAVWIIFISQKVGNPLLNDNIISIIQLDYFSNLLEFQTIMTSFKRPFSVLQSTPIIIDSDSEDVQLNSVHKKVKTNPEINFGSNPYQAIPQVPTINLTVQQMNSDPLELFRMLEEAHSQFGAVKLTVAEAWNSPFTFGNADRSVTVRLQTLQELTMGKVMIRFTSFEKCFFLYFRLTQPFQQKVQSLRISKYKQNALNFTKLYKFKTSPSGSSNQAKREHQYWNLVLKPEFSEEEVTVQYAADLPSSLYGSGFPTRKMHNWLDADFQYEKNLFNLNNLYKSPTSLLRIIDDKKEKISGITIPWMYVGMQFATFCWHVEDLFLNSINYNHIGETKTWYVVPGKYKEAFDNYVKNHYEKGKKKNLLQKITLMIDPIELIKAGITVYKVHQRPRDYVVTFLKAYHCGFSHGFNIGEAVNFISFNSVDCIKEAYRYYESKQKLQNRKMRSHVLSFEWMIYEIVNQKLLSKASPFYENMMKQYRRILNCQYVLIKGNFDKYGNFSEVKMIGAKKRYYTNMCSHCKNYIYLSSLECSNCHKNLCEKHLDQCECLQKKWILIVRELNEDRMKLKELVPLIQKMSLQLK